MKEALLVLFVYWAICELSIYLNSQYVAEPIIYATAIGLVMGDLKTGLIMGAALEAIFLGVMDVGGAKPAEPAIGTVVATYFVIKSGCDIETGLALAYPIGTLGITAFNLFTGVKLALIPWWEKVALHDMDMKKYDRWMNAWGLFIHFAPKYIITFLALWLGTEGLTVALGAIPAWVLTGLTASGKALTAVGMGVTLSLLWNKETGMFFFIGFVMCKVLGMSVTACAMIGISLAVVYFFIDQRILANKNAIENGAVAAPADSDDVGGDFF